MDIFICTHGRQDRQITYKELPREIRERTTLVIQEREVHWWKEKWEDYNFLVLPTHITTIGPTREYLVNNYGPKICMLDDDIVFATRRDDEPTKFVPSSMQDIVNLFRGIEEELDHHAHVGVSHREGANRNTEPHLYNSRYMRILAYRTDILRKECEYGRVVVMEDFDINLQLLKKGYKSILINNYVHNQGGSDTSGGCSTFRTPKVQTETAYEMARLHDPFVKAVKKQTKTSWGGGERTDVIIYWKKAFASAKEEQNVQPI